MQKNRIAGILAAGSTSERSEGRDQPTLIFVGRNMPVIEVNDALDGRLKRVTIGPGMYWCSRTFYTDERDEWSTCRTKRHRTEILGGEIGSLLSNGQFQLLVRQTAEEIDERIEASQKRRGVEIVKDVAKNSDFAASVRGED